MEFESQAPGYFAVVSWKFEIPLQFCERLKRSFRMAHQSRVKELGRFALMRLVKLPPLSVLAVSGDAFHAGSA